MPKYSYTAVTIDGRKVRGREEAMTAHRVYSLLLSRQLKPVSVKEHKSLLKRDITTKKVKRKDLMHFSRQLAVFVRAGIPILEALEIIGEEVTDKVFKRALYEVADQIRGGDTFAGSAAQHPEAFPSFYIGILRSAEATGNLDEALDQLASYIERDEEAKKKIVSALIYPAIIMVMGIITVLVLTIYVLPRFKSFFESFDAELPLQTRILVYVSSFATSYWWLLLGSTVTFFGGTFLMSRTPRGRAFLDKILLKIPVMGTMVHHAILERFCRVLASMIRTGVPLPEGMALVADGANNAVYRVGISAAREAMLRGEGLAQPLADTKLFPSAARQMIRVGEETGTLDEQLETAAKYYESELDYQIKRFTGLFEPAIIVVMGVCVGFVAVALISAMYGIFGQVEEFK